MVCKEEVVHWFQGLESYKRIDTMCKLLTMCVPFELRFLGTCMEELGTLDSKDLRTTELRYNNSNELAQELASAKLYDPSDKKVRRKMALYFALIRVCSPPCANELFNIIYTWSNDEYLEQAEGEPLQELLLVYTMAANHPVFSFEQRMKCGEICNKILYGTQESTFGEVSMNVKSEAEQNPNQSNVVLQSMFTVQNPTANVAPDNFDDNRGSQVR